MNIEEWARKNKKRIAREFVKKTNKKHQNNSGIFTAGVPGAGKTEFTVELIKNLENTPVRIDMDEIATEIEGYKPQIADKFRAGATIILEKIYDEVTKQRYDFVFDGTFGHDKAIKNVKRAIDHDYSVKIYYIHQDPKIAWQFTKDREVVERRSINKIRFIKTYIKLRENIEYLCNNHKNVTISLVKKDEKNKIGSHIEDVENLFDHIPEFLTESELNSVLL